MLKNSQIQSIMMVLGVGGTALAGHLEARRQRRFRVIGRVLDFVADIPPMEIFPSLLHVAGQVSTANPDAWRSLLHDLASISQERFDLKVIEASMHGMMLAMQNVETDAGQAPDKSGAAHANGGVTAAECERVLVREAIARLEDKLGEVLRELADERRRPVAPTNSGEAIDKVIQAMLMAIETFRYGLPVERTKEVIATADLRETVAVKEVIEEALKGMAQALATVCKGPPVQDSTPGEFGELRSQLAHEEVGAKE